MQIEAILQGIIIIVSSAVIIGGAKKICKYLESKFTRGIDKE